MGQQEIKPLISLISLDRHYHLMPPMRIIVKVPLSEFKLGVDQ